MDWRLCATVLIFVSAYIHQTSGSVLSRQRRQDFLCEEGQTKIQGPWVWDDNRTCGDLIGLAANEFNFDLRSRQECKRFLDLPEVPEKLAGYYLFSEDCTDLENGTARYRLTICCNETTPELRCISCASPIVKDGILQAYQAEDCNYYNDITTCEAGQVCMSYMEMVNDGEVQTFNVYKSCEDKAYCDAMKNNDSFTCVNRQPYIGCTECCEDQFCNLNSELPNLKPEPVCENEGEVTITGPFSWECACPPGTTGEQCDADMCDEQPCKNEGVCLTVEEDPYYTCYCPPQFIGDDCDEDAPLCPTGDPYCENNGTCYDHGGEMKICVCPGTHWGSRCLNERLECETEEIHLAKSEAFKNNIKTCDDMYNKLQKEIDRKYHMKPCLQHMGGTYTSGKSFGAVKQLPYIGLASCVESGENIGVWSTAEMCCPGCFSSPCQNEGYCVPKALTDPGYICKCRFGYEGTHCEVRSAVCFATGDAHFITFDGLKFPYQGDCVVELVSTRNMPDLEHQFDIYLKQEFRGESTIASYIGFVEITLNSTETVRLDRDNVVTVNGEVVQPSYETESYEIFYNGRYVRLQTSYGLIVENDGVWNAIVKLPGSEYANVTVGLCGNYNGKPEDDYMCNGTDYSNETNKYSQLGNCYLVDYPEFGNCTSPVEDTPPCTEEKRAFLETEAKCGYLKKTDNVFTDCLDAMDTYFETFYEQCIYDACIVYPNNDDIKNAVCNTWDALALACRNEKHDVGTSWRGDTGCYPDCGDKVYSSPTSACPVECSKPNAKTLCILPDTEACECPSEYPVLKDGVCVKPEECNCQDTEDKGTEHSIGSHWYSAGCENRYDCVACSNCDQPVGRVMESDGCEPHEKCSNATGVLECVPRCPPDGPREWKPANTNCQLSCSQRIQPTVCESGCRCKPGFVDDDNGNCVQPEKCGCVDPVMDVNTDLKDENCRTFECLRCNEADCNFPQVKRTSEGCDDEEVCRDVNGVYVCTEECGANATFQVDTTACPATCDNPSAPEQCQKNNTYGCRCDEGTIELENGVCIHPHDCGCKLPSGQRVAIGEEWDLEDCRRMRCDKCTSCSAEVGEAKEIQTCDSYGETCTSECEYQCIPDD